MNSLKSSYLALLLIVSLNLGFARKGLLESLSDDDDKLAHQHMVNPKGGTGVGIGYGQGSGGKNYGSGNTGGYGYGIGIGDGGSGPGNGGGDGTGVGIGYGGSGGSTNQPIIQFPPIQLPCPGGGQCQGSVIPGLPGLIPGTPGCNPPIVNPPGNGCPPITGCTCPPCHYKSKGETNGLPDSKTYHQDESEPHLQAAAPQSTP